jgi:26S proteasome regulatory subunit T4
MSAVRVLHISTSPSTHYFLLLVIVKASSGPRYVVSYRPALPAHKLKAGTRVSLDMTTLTIMRILPREVDPMVYKMSLEDPGSASFAGIGGLSEQVRELREVRPR